MSNSQKWLKTKIDSIEVRLSNIEKVISGSTNRRRVSGGGNAEIERSTDPQDPRPILPSGAGLDFATELEKLWGHMENMEAKFVSEEQLRRIADIISRMEQFVSAAEPGPNYSGLPNYVSSDELWVEVPMAAEAEAEAPETAD
ncbi:hypothetical protein [Pseudooceanicola nitratireducens]|uniref:hypothetical protein n=1 Tax=Pseudooceanicola nitratireducens TaxID=517719 RepID=UPI001C96BF81|nr:hypothetical protein [Pseudooceanicola nitratireducens]MBY6158866.1 hypothetical protein [Pseudooceanicola nitratireducens]